MIAQNYGELVPPNYGELVKRAKNGDRLAFEELYQGCYAFVVFVCKPFCESKEDLEDVTQDVFLQAFSKINQLKDDDMFLAWIKRIAIHKCYRNSDDAKKYVGSVVYTENLNTAKSEIEEINQSFLPEDCFENGEVRKELIGAVSSLPDMQRKMVHLYYYVGMNTVEISRLHKCTDSYVRKTLYNARNSIKEKMRSRDMSGAKVVSLGAFFMAEEAAFVASYSAINATTISATAATVAGTAVTQAAFAAKIATAGSVAACVLATGLIGTGVYYITQAFNPEEIDLTIQTEIAVIEEYNAPAGNYTEYICDVIEEDNGEEIYINEYADITLYVPDARDEQTDAEQIYEPEPYDEEQIPYEPEAEVDRTTEILAALANANTNARVSEIIRQYGFSVKLQFRCAFDEIYRFYQTNQGSGDILIGIREYVDGWHMSFRFFEGGSINMQEPELISWLESSV